MVWWQMAQLRFLGMKKFPSLNLMVWRRRRPLGEVALGPFFFLGDGATVEIDLPLKTTALGEEFLWCPLTKVSSLYIDSWIPVIQIMSSVGPQGASELRLG